MKRIIQCPKCQAKLAVFDLGKPINQKCPKCGNAFVVDSESKKTDSAEPTSPEAQAPVPAPEVKAEETPAPAETKAEADVKKETAKPATKKNGKTKTAKAPEAPEADTKKDEPAPESKDDKKPEPPAEKPAAADAAKPKEITLKKPEERPVNATLNNRPAAKPSSMPEPSAPEATPHACGFSFMHFAVIAGLLVIVIIMQVMAKISADKHYGKLIEHLQFIETKIGK